MKKKRKALPQLKSPSTVMPLKLGLAVGTAVDASVLIGGLLWPVATADDDVAYIPYLHYTYDMYHREDIGLLPGQYMAKPPLVSGHTAQQKYALPIHTRDDAPPDVYFDVMYPSGAMVGVKEEGPAHYDDPVWDVHVDRTGGGFAYIVGVPVGPTELSGPFKLHAE